ncbi:hypothetical protein DFH29DRAFT_800528 [Suillus ampliporus]|nr:hypothetical protein DFH29DRAFT_800528 [Suillus ampliporus]
MDNALAQFYNERRIFIDIGVKLNGISLLCQHALVYYHTHMELYSTLNGLYSPITELKYIKAVKKLWRRSNHHLPLG